MNTTPNRGARALMLERLETRRPLAADLQFTAVAPEEHAIQLAPPLASASPEPVVRSSNVPGLEWSPHSGRQNSLWLAPALITTLPPYVPAGAMPTARAEAELVPVAPRSPLVLPPAPRLHELATAHTTQWIEGDFDGDGVRELGQFANGKWWIDVDHNGQMDASDVWADFGQVGDRPIIADFNGDGVDEPAVATTGGMPRIGHIDFSEANPQIVAIAAPAELAAEPPVPAYRVDSGELVWHDGAAPQVANRTDEPSR